MAERLKATDVTVGSRVRISLANPPWHHRVPGYARGRVGVVLCTQGVWDRPDDSARGVAPRREAVHSVALDSQDLWGPEAERFDVVIDVWSGDLEKVK
jgi:nitrile hydratase subunit beta